MQEIIVTKRAYVEVDLAKLEYNLGLLHDNVEEKSKILAVIKADAYGHGALQIAKRLESNELVYGYATAAFEEALALRKEEIRKPLLILGHCFRDQFKELIINKVTPAIYNLEDAIELNKIAGEMNKSVPIHIKVDTGMSRLGIYPNEAGVKFCEDILGLEFLEIEGIFSHFACADEEDKANAYEQLEKFNKFVAKIEKTLSIKIPFKHVANSAAIVSLQGISHQLIRAGISMYGFLPEASMSSKVQELKPVLSLYSSVVHIKDGEIGERVSYGGHFQIDRPMKIATISIGYADGYPRALSGKGYVIIRGKKAKILGNICMDQLMVDVSDIDGVEMGDRVTLIGKDGEEEITLIQLCELADLFHYEVLCNINARVSKTYIN